MLSKAHILSAENIIDPVYSAERLSPAPVTAEEGPFWLYGESEYESFMLMKMRADVIRSELKVGYPGVFHTASRKGIFSVAAKKGEFLFRANGNVFALLDGKEIAAFADSPSEKHRLNIPRDGRLELDVQAEDIPCILPLEGIPADAEWSFSLPHEPGTSGVGKFRRPLTNQFPHMAGRPVTDIRLAANGGDMFDAGREVYGRIEVRSSIPEQPSVYPGEVVPEAMNRNSDHFEQAVSLDDCGNGIWRSKNPLAFRYVVLKNASKDAPVSCRAMFTPARYRGAFASEDMAGAQDIWMRSAYTLRMCTDNFLVDGVKRDHLPWAGDLRVSLLASAFAFGDGGYIRATLAVLGREGIRQSHVNGIIDYSLWLIICHDSYQRYFGDAAFLEREYPRIKDMFGVLQTQEDADGFLIPGQWLFIDWLEMQKTTALQILYFAALKAGSALAERMNDGAFAASLSDKAEILRGHITEAAFDTEKGLFRSAVEKDAPATYTRHPDFLAVLFGVVEGSDARRICETLSGDSLPRTGTPFMAAMEISALAKCGMLKAAADRLSSIWGAMLKDGATTFYEAFDPSAPEDGKYEFYGRPYALSCCHAWSSAPAYLLPELAFGVRPLSDGWKTFEAFDTGLFRNAHCTVPTPYGDIELDLENGVLEVKHPDAIRRVSAGKDGVR